MADNNTQTQVPTIKEVIKNPRITEKGALLQDKNVYVFNVASNADKTQIAKQIEAVYKVKPLKVTTARTAAKPKFVRGRKGTRAGIKKAYVFLKKDDKITVM